MKSLTVFESSVIGFFVGAVISTYILCVDATGGYVGHILSFVSLRPVLDLFTVPPSAVLVVDFVFFVLVYTMYAAIIGFFAKKNIKSLLFFIPAIIILGVAVFFEQKSSPSASFLVADSYSAIQTLTKHAVSAAPQQYFGTEAVGDLNGDGKDDVAFILSRSDPDRGVLYYLSAALTIDAGHQGTNLVFLGNNVVPQGIDIFDGVITIPYTDDSAKAATSTKYFYAHVIGEDLEQIQMVGKGDALSWGVVSANGDRDVFKPCDDNGALLLDGSSTVLKAISDELSQTASTSASTSSAFGALVGKKHAISSKNASSSAYSAAFSLDGAFDLVPNGSCR